MNAFESDLENHKNKNEKNTSKIKGYKYSFLKWDLNISSYPQLAFESF